MKKILCIFIFLLSNAYGEYPEHCILIDQILTCYDLQMTQRLPCLEDAASRFSHLRGSIYLTDDEAKQTANIRSSFYKCLETNTTNIKCSKNFIEEMKAVYRCP